MHGLTMVIPSGPTLVLSVQGQYETWLNYNYLHASIQRIAWERCTSKHKDILSSSKWFLFVCSLHTSCDKWWSMRCPKTLVVSPVLAAFT